MNEQTIEISVEEYKKLIEVAVMIEAFSDFVKKGFPRLDKEMCASFLGFELEDKRKGGTDK